MNNPNEWNKRGIEEFRANDGKVGGFFEDATLLLLHTTGAKSGLPRVNPVVCMPDDNKFVIMASKEGRPTNPDWYYNLVANPKVSIEVGTEYHKAIAHVADEPERTELFNKMSALYPRFAEYQQNTTRVIPVIILSRQP